jgi:excisionase family DNA binding protein
MAASVNVDLLTLTESAAALRISKPTLYRLMETGELATVKIRRRTFIERGELTRFIARHRTRGASP